MIWLGVAVWLVLGPTTPQHVLVSSQVIEPAARAAMNARNFELAGSLWRGAVALRGDGDAVALELAATHTLCGDMEGARLVLTRLQAATQDPQLQQQATTLLAQLGPSGYPHPCRFRPATKEARDLFMLGRQAVRAHGCGLALPYFEAAAMMAPDLSGPTGQLTGCLAQAATRQQKVELWERYLEVAGLSKAGQRAGRTLDAMGAATKAKLTSSFPCDEVWVDGVMAAKGSVLPLTDVYLSPGPHRVLCPSSQYHFVGLESFTAVRGQTTQVTVAWAIIENRLDPAGRITVEDPATGTMHDIGPWPEVGIPAPAVPARKVVLVDMNGTRQVGRSMQIVAGQRYPIIW